MILTKRQYEKKFPNVKPAGRHRSVANPRFRDPCHFQIDNPRWTLCQGWVSSEAGGNELHSWLEFGGIVLDLWNDLWIRQADYAKIFRPRSVRRYTVAQARAAMDKYRTYRFPPEEEELS